MKKRRIISAFLALVVFISSLLGGKSVYAATNSATFGVISYQNAILLDGAAYNESMTYYSTNGKINLSGNQSRRITNTEIANGYTGVAYCVEPTQETPAAANVSFTGDDLYSMVGSEYNSGQGTRTFTIGQYEKIQKLIKYGYPGGTEYWTNHGVGDVFVQQTVTQMAIWYVTSDNWGSYADRIARTVNGTGGFSVNTSVYTDSLGGDEMLRELIKIASDMSYEPSMLNPEVTVSAVGSSFSNGLLTSSYSVDVTGAGHGMYIEAAGLPSSYVLKVDGNVRNFDSDGRLWLMTTGYANYPTSGHFDVTIESAQASTIVLTSTAPKASEGNSVYFGLTNQQKVISADVFFEGTNDYASATTSMPIAKVSLFKKDNNNSAALEGIYFELKVDDPNNAPIYGWDGVSYYWSTDATGYIDFNIEFGKAYYLREVENGDYKDNACKFVSVGGTSPVEIDFSLSDYIKVYADFDSKRLYINDQDAGELFWSDAHNAYLTTSDASNGEAYYLNVYNERPDIDFVINKVDKGRNNLSGQTFALYDANKNVIATTNSLDGKVDFSYKYEWDKDYFVAETKNTGYLSELSVEVGNETFESQVGSLIPLKFTWADRTVNFGGKTASLVAKSTEAFELNEAVTIINDEQSMKFTVLKTGEVLVSYSEGNGFTWENREIEGVTFGVYTDDKCEFPLIINGNAYTLTTDLNGVATSTELPLGTYYVKELSVANQSVNSLLVSDEVKVVSASANDSGAVIESSLEFTDKPQKLDLLVTKVNENDKVLSGAEFTVYANEKITDYLGNEIVPVGTKLNVLTSDATGRVSLAGLPCGSYKFVETKAPKGYVNEKIEVVLESSFDASKGETVTLTRKVTNKKQQINLIIYKVDADDNTVKLDGATFELYAKEDIVDLDGNVILANTLIDTKETANGELVFANVCAGKYYAKETIAPKGYALLTESVEFVAEYGSETANLEHFEIEKTVANKKIKLLIAKHDAVGIIQDQLAGAKLHIEDENGNVVYSFTTKDVPEDISGIVSPGKYLLVEDDAPEGFMIAEPIEIEILDTDELQTFDMYDEAILGGLTFSYDASSDWLRGGVGSDVPATGDLSNMMFYLMLMIGALVTMILAKINKKSLIKVLMCMAIIFMIPMQVFAAEDSEDTKEVSKEYTSTNKEEKTTFDSYITVDGVKYELEEVKYIVTPKNTKENKTLTQTMESDTLYADKSADSVFAESITVDGQEYKYIKADKITLEPITNRSELYAEAVKYIGYVGVESVADSQSVNAYDPLNKTYKVVNLPKTSTVIDKTYWEACAINATIRLTGPYYVVDNEIVAYNENDPQLEGHEAYILNGLGLEADKYKIKSFSWNGEIYERDGVKYRDVIANGERLLNDYTITYSGLVNFDDVNNVYMYKATYERKEEVAADVQTYDIVAKGIYKVVEPEITSADNSKSGLSQKTLVKVLTITITAFCIAALILVFLFFLKRRKNTIEATTYTKDDETRRF